MTEWRERIVLSLVFVVLLISAYTAVYQWAMLTFEGVSITITAALQVVVETLTTAGFGGDTEHWNSHAMNLLVVGMNLTGVLLVFLALPLFVVPLFREAFEGGPPESTDLTDHVVICSYTPREDVLRSELEAAGVPYVVIEEDPETVMELNDRGIEAIVGDLEHKDTFRAANIDAARAVVTDVSDEQNVSVILTVKELRESVTVISVAETEDDAVYHRYAGADRVVRPRQILGQSLGEKVTLSITHEFRETIDLGSDFELSELLVKEGSDLAGQTLAESGLRDRIGATVIGLWSNGEFVPVPEPDIRIDENTILLVAGSHQELEEVNSRSGSPVTRREDGIVIAGYGVVGQSVAETLDEAGLSYTVVDAVDGDDVDIVGDITDRETLEAAAVEDARFVVLALNDDTATMYATVVLERVAPDTEVIARANDVENTKKLYRAGSEYVLALSTVTGRMLSSLLVEDEEILTPETQFEIIRTADHTFDGQTLEEAAIRERTGATVVAAERNGDLLTNLGSDFTVQKDDVLIVAGSDEAVNEFIEIAR